VYGEAVDAGVYGHVTGDVGSGVFGHTGGHGAGVVGRNTSILEIIDGAAIDAGVFGHATGGTGVIGLSDATDGTGVFGESVGPNGTGVGAINSNTNAKGLLAGRDPFFKGAVGVYKESPQNGVFGRTTSSGALDNAVYGQNDGAGQGVSGVCKGANGSGVAGFNSNTNARGLIAGREPVSNHLAGVYGESTDAGVVGHATGDTGTGVFGHSASAKGVAVIGLNSGGGLAGEFDGQFEINGHLQHNGDIHCKGDIFLPGADCAEHFDIADMQEIEPGTVMVINQEGTLQPSQQAYDRKVAGVVSGGGKYKAGIILDKQESQTNRLPIALVGKVYCKVDASCTPIEVGDLLTTSPVSGHAMKANDPIRAFGSVIGKALRPLYTGQGLIPILIALQ